MGARKSRIGRKSLSQRFEQIPEAEELKAILLGPCSVSEVADIMQQEWGRFTDNTRASLMTRLYVYRKKLREGHEPQKNTEPGKVESLSRRAITRAARKRYDKVIDSVDRMLELEALYLVQRDRLEWLLEEEQKEGIPYNNMSRDFVAATNTLLAHLKVEMTVLGVPDKESEVAVSFDRYSENTAKALANPESRRRVVSLIERIQRNANQFAQRCDGPVSCVPDIELDIPGEPVTVFIEEK